MSDTQRLPERQGAAADAPPLDAVRTGGSVPLQVTDLDAAFKVKLRTLIALFTPLMYEGISARVDVAALRGQGIVSVVSSLDFRRSDLAAAVAAPLDTTVETRLSELSGDGPGTHHSRLGFDIAYTFATPPGAGEPRRYREQLSPEPLNCGSGRIILTLLRPTAPTAERLVRASRPELDHLRLHVLEEPHPSVESLSAVGDAFTAPEDHTAEIRGRYGLQHTDVNQYVYTGEYTAAMEDMATRLVADAGLPVDRHSIDRIAAVFKFPFSAGDAYAVRGRLFQDAGRRTVALVGIHPMGPDGPRLRPAVFGRVEGTC
ncbi:hypothetical protein ABZ565_09845 [Streptomyces sp. NPDC016469]|uniref:hypothetical protein n=1 Tax=Streptomyces sp. NPDC016469 TaxID=3157191 RepID=UPI0034063EF1